MFSSSQYLGDIKSGDIIYFMWNTYSIAGASVTRTIDGTISVYKNNSTSQTTTGVTDTEDFDGLIGVHLVTINTVDSFYESNKDYTVVVSGTTIDGQIINACIGSFSIENRFTNVVQWSSFNVSAGSDGLPEVNSILANISSIDNSTPSAENLNFILNGTGATLTLTKLRINAADAAGAVDIDNSAGSAISAISSSGHGVYLQGGAGGNGLCCVGNGAGAGVLTTGGNTGEGFSAIGGAVSGNGFGCYGSATNAGFYATGGVNGDGANFVGGAVTGNGIIATCTEGNGMSLVGGTGGYGLGCVGDGFGAGIYSIGGINGSGLYILGGGVAGAAAVMVSQSADSGLLIQSPLGNGVTLDGNINGFSSNGVTGYGLNITSDTSYGALVQGGSKGLVVTATGADEGMRIVGGVTGHGVYIAGGAAGGNGVYITSPTTNDVDADIFGDLLGDVSGNIGGTLASVGTVTGNVNGSVGSVTGAVGSVGGNVGGNITGSVASVVGNVGGNVVGSVASVTGNVVGSVGSVAANGITAASIAANAITSSELDTTALTAIADTLFTRDFALVAGAVASRSALNALRKLVNDVVIAAGTLTIYDEVGVAVLQQTVTTAAVDPIVSVVTI